MRMELIFYNNAMHSINGVLWAALAADIVGVIIAGSLAVVYLHRLGKKSSQTYNSLIFVL